MKQGSAEWLTARCGRITGSRFAAVMAIGARGKPLQERRNLVTTLALERLTKMPAVEPANTAMQWGTEHEAEARDWYVFERGVSVTETAFVLHPELAYVGVSPDGLVGDDGLLEIKCPFNPERHVTNLLSRSVPDEYVPQVQGQLWVTGRRWLDFVSYDPRLPGSLQGVIVRVDHDKEYAEKLAEQCEEVNNEADAVLARLLEIGRAA